MRFLRVAPLFALIPTLCVAGCSNSTTPTSSSSTTTVPTSSSTTPVPVTPANGASVAYASQPLTLTVKNAVTTSPVAPTYTFQVSTDKAFASITATKAGVAQGASGQTSVTIDTLPGATTYYWRAQIVAGTDAGLTSAPVSFAVGPQVVIQAPALASPANGETVTNRPTLTVANAQRTGPAGSIEYRFEVAADTTFATLAYSASAVAERATGTTAHTVTTALEARTYYWRVRASSPSTQVVGSYSAVGNFTVSNGVDLNTATIVIGPQNIGTWEQTAKISSAYFDPINEQLCIFHDHLNVWPATQFNADGTMVEGNQWIFAQINGQWYGAAADWYRPGQACKSLNAETIGRDAVYQTPASPLYSWQPRSGETFAVMVTTPARAWPEFKTYDERSDIVYIRWP